MQENILDEKLVSRHCSFPQIACLASVHAH